MKDWSAGHLIYSSEPHSKHFLVRATSKCSSFHFFFFKCALIYRLKIFFRNPATLGHKKNNRFSRLNFIIRIKLKFSMCHVLLNLWIVLYVGRTDTRRMHKKLVIFAKYIRNLRFKNFNSKKNKYLYIFLK